MKWILTPPAIKNYIDAPIVIQQAFDKKANLLLQNLRHPSLRAKKYEETGNVWQARINLAWRFYFIIENDCYTILRIKKHPK